MVNKKKILIPLVSLCTYLTMNVGSAFAWSYSDYSHGSYVPKNGDISRTISSDKTYFITRVDFTLDSTNRTSILDYNNGGDNPGTSCDNKQAYLTLDQTAVPENTLDLEISASSVVSNLPNPKYDLEVNYVGIDNDESEVVALGSVSAYSYYMRTAWNDYRDGGSLDGGKIQAQFAMSNLGVSDYIRGRLTIYSKIHSMDSPNSKCHMRIPRWDSTYILDILRHNCNNHRRFL
ncbi:hypothetical protein [Heliophilum fasciatum]|uniref:Uncharacterized protein n=1 Tax=Heliophilum fasciatum TaxID=35700 RepID=A0A4R2RYP5_9FIRM|nr:hypothetical protein [Heliophilum fasciatum]MCW2276806.1 hypothetical protein [Heliophilum fasciatum]TCP68733.1 hypothetical protein EDD73_102129 [Heliophilum fasciatum]